MQAMMNNRSSRTARGLILLAAALLFVVSPAFAQRGGRGGSGGNAIHPPATPGQGPGRNWPGHHPKVWGGWGYPYAFEDYPASGYYNYGYQGFDFFNPYLGSPFGNGQSNFDFLFP
jgi:hypothetical protein